MLGFGANAMADSTDDIVNALIAKGVLTEEEGALLQKGRAGEKEAAEKKAKSAVTAKYKDGIVIGTEDGKNSIQINGRVHADYRSYDHSESSAGTGGSTGADTFTIRRARIGAKVRFLDYYTGEVVFNGTGDAGGAGDLDVAYLNVAWWKPVQFRFGQYKQPFSLEELTSSNNIDFVERSFADAQFIEKQAGAMVHGSPLKGVTYALSLANGNDQNAAEDDIREDSKDVIGRVTANFAEIMDNKDMVLHVGAAYATGDLSKSTAAKIAGGNRKTESQGATFFNVPTFTNSGSEVSVDRDRYNLETALAYGPFKLQGQYINANYDYDQSNTVSIDEDITTWYAQALWTITGESHASRYKDGAFGALKPKNDFNPSTLSGGAWEVGVRYSSFDASDFRNSDGTAKAAGVKGFAEADAWTVGLKFVPNAHVRFMLDYVKTDFNKQIGNVNTVLVNGKEVDDEKAILFRTQFAF
jgi:phosphate-selective porin OprO/OprP